MTPLAHALSVAASLLLVGCSGLSFGDKKGDASPPAEADASAVPGATGADCAVMTGGTTLCTAISVCPQIVVDHDLFPHCGYRVHGDALDLECDCDGALCPLGSPATCDQARQLLAAQSEITVCTQVAEGRCTGGTTGGPDAGSGTCDRACASQCAGDPSCLTSCGC